MEFTAEISDTETIFIDTVVYQGWHDIQRKSYRWCKDAMETFQYTSEPPVSDHRKCKHLVVVYKNRTTGVLFQEEARARLIYERLFVAYNYVMCISMLLLKFFVYFKYHFAQSRHRDQRIRQEVVVFKRPKKWSRSLTGGGRLLEVPTVRLRLGNFPCFG